MFLRDAYYHANTGHSPNAVSMLGQRRRRRANIETALGECVVFAGFIYTYIPSPASDTLETRSFIIPLFLGLPKSSDYANGNYCLNVIRNEKQCDKVP